MTQVATNLRNTRESARQLRFESTTVLTATNVQVAIEQAATQSSGGVIVPTAVSSSPYSVLPTDTVLYVDTSGGPITILLEPSVDRGGLPISIKDVTGDALTNNITVTPDGAETIDGLTPYLITSAYGGVRLNPRTSSYTVAP